MKKLYAFAMLLCATILFASEKVYSAQIEQFVGQTPARFELTGTDGKTMYVTYNGDVLVVEVENRETDRQKTDIIGIYRSYTGKDGSVKWCIIHVQRTKISPVRVTLNAHVDPKQTEECSHSTDK